jgi:predicted signal transduction protein with EAL and GGDEF domain
VREYDTVARLGGDEFAIILSDVKGAEECAHIAANILKSLAAPCAVLGSEVVSGASLGITFYPIDGEREEDLLKHADVAMYRAKERGKNAYQFFTDDMAATVAESLRIESGLRHALEAGELSLAYQPQVSHRGEVIGAEALMRWYSPELGHVPPARFIPIAEKSGLIWDLGDFAIREACRQCAAWRERLFPGFRISVNLSAAQFRNEGLVGRVAETLCDFGLDGTALELEITESVVMDDVGRGLEVLERLKRLGCRLAIDDFGTGYSSLAYLKRFQVDVLKIDKSFVDGLGSGADANSDDLAVVQAVLSLARSLRLEVVAEGVETDEQFSCLKGLAGAEGFLAQGYLYSPPLPAPAFEQLYADLERDVPKLCAAL